MKVSVIIPNYNHAPFLDRRIRTVLDQTFRDFEVIILDDFSTDNSRDIIEQYRDHPCVSAIVYNEANSGSTFKQWHKGIQLAKGEWIWIAESDDWCEEQFLETLLTGAGDKENCNMAFCNSYIIDDTGTRKDHSNETADKYLDGNTCFNLYLLPANRIFNASMVIFRRSAAIQVPPGYSSFRFCGDWFFWICLTMHSDVFVCGKRLNYCRQHSGDVSSKAYSSGYNFIEELQVLEMIRKTAWVPDARFRLLVLEKYGKYLKKSRSFNSKVNMEIKDAFSRFFKSYWSFSFFSCKAKLISLKGKVNARLSMPFKRNTNPA